MCTAESFVEGYLVAEFPGHSTQHGHSLFHYLGADAIAGQHCNVQFHISILLVCPYLII